jgi:hypothetical protein
LTLSIQATLVDRVDGPPGRGIGRHGPKHLCVGPQDGEVGQAVGSVGECHRQIGEHLAGVVRRAASSSWGHRLRQTTREAQTVGHLGEEQRPRVGHDPRAVGGDMDARSRPLWFTCKVPSRCGVLLARSRSFPYQEGVFADSGG